MESLVERSLFLRCPPPDERKDAYYNVVTPNPGEYPDFIRALKPRETTNTADSLISPVILKCMAKRGRILQLHEAMESSEDGVQYLENLVLKKGIPIDTPWRVKRKLLVLSKWRKKVNMVSNLLKFQRFLEPKQQKDTDGTPPMPTKSPYMQQAMAAASGLSSQSSQTALSSPTPSLFLSKQDTIKATPLKSRLDHKESPSSVVASIEHPAPSRANSTPRHVTLVLPKSPCTSASILAQPSTIHIPHSTKTIYVPNHLASPSVLTPLMAEGEVEKGNAPLSSSFIKSLSTLTLTPEVERTLHASIQQRQHWQEDQPVSFKYQQESHQPSTPKHQQEYHQPTKPRYKPYYKPSQECLSKGNNDRELGEVCSGTHVGVKCSTAIHCHSYGEQMREEECPGSSTDFRPTPLRDQAPPRLLGAWTENIASLPIPIERGGSGLPSDLGTKTPSSYPLSDSPLTSSSVPLPPLGSQATDTNFPDPDTCTLYSSSVIGGRMNDVNPPALAVEKINSGNSAENIAQSPSASSSRDPLTSWCSSLESGQWPLLSDIDLAPLRSGTVFSPLSPISSTGPLTTSPNFPRPGCTISSKPGKDRPRILETPHHPYHKQSRGCNRKM
ncbi:hypothetical protein DPEC_G00153890 [Dallia pectoralis]|uniref:Uncharacterized protein n=1 Tax=Dallia pectoralis TaxID=75939 RepID=A0ACC2GKH5_DALPE|nr:hypothetical protein DPEC_G00153890 [Dallia pectoralis]